MSHPTYRDAPVYFLAQEAPIPSMREVMVDICTTTFPRTPHREVSCPCGEVIWVLSPSSPDLMSIIASTRDDPLPPLDDLDEGLICCQRTYPTFAAYMQHRREHGEG